MQIVGFGACGYKNGFSRTPIPSSEFTTTIVKNCTIDDLFITRNTGLSNSNLLVGDWDYDTILHAKFNGNLSAGNVDYTLDQVSALRIKRREVGALNWITLYEIPINNVTDFNFERVSYLERSNTKYEFAIVPVNNGIEGNYNTNTVDSLFDGVVLVDRNAVFKTVLNTSISMQKNRNGATVAPVGRRYPLSISNGFNNYDSGSIKATFIQQIGLEFDVKNGWRWRRDFMNYLVDSNVKVLKFYDGRMWLVAITGNPLEDSSAHIDMPYTSFDWTEVGDVEKSKDLYKYGLIDVDLDPDTTDAIEVIS